MFKPAAGQVSSISADPNDAFGSDQPCPCPLVPRIGVAQDVEERMVKWSKGKKPCFISCNFAALDKFEFTSSDMWSRKKPKAVPSRKPEVSASHWNDMKSQGLRN